MKLSVKFAAIFAVVAFALTAVAASAAYTRDLTLGSTGADVIELQTWLESKGVLTIPAGVSKGYFGALTQSAVAKWQASVGLPSTGYFGQMSRAKVGTPSTGGDTGSDNGSSDLKGGAGDATITEKSSGTQDEVLEGKEEAKVLGFEVEAEGSDIDVTSVKVELTHSGTGSDKLSRYVDEVQVIYDGEVVGSADASDFSESNDVYSKSIPVSKSVVAEDEKGKFYVAVTAVSNIDSNDLGTDWTVTLDQIRFEDATGAILTGSATNVNEVFTFEDLASSGDIELTINEEDESINDAHTVQIDETGDTNDVELLSFSMEADGSDIYLNQLTLDVTSSGAGVTEIANDFRLLMGDEEVGTVTVDRGQDGGDDDGFASNTDTAISLVVTDLDDDDVVIEDGDTVSFTLVADINDIGGSLSNGDSLTSAISSTVAADIDAEDENGDAVTDLTGSAESDAIAFAASGIMLAKGDDDTSSTIENVDTTSTDNQGKYVVYFDVTAFDDPAYIALTGTTTAASTTAAGVYAYAESVNNNDSAASGTTTVTLERVSGGTISGSYIKINAGQTATLKATVYFDPSTSGTYRGQVGAVNYASTAAAGTATQSASPTSDYQSPSELVNN